MRAAATARPSWLAEIRLVALDLDGTIMVQGTTIPPGIVDALHRLRDLGVAVTTDSGRPLDFQLDLIGRHGLDADATVTALITDERHVHLATRQDGRSTFLPLPGWNDAVDARWRRLLPTALHWTNEALREADRRGWGARLHLDPEEAAQRGMTALALPEPEMAERLHRWLDVRLDGSGLGATVNVRLLQVLDALAGKGAVLARLCDSWRVERSAVLAVGDSHNDRSMLDGSGSFRSATPADAPEAIRSVVLANDGIVASQPGVAGTQEVLEALAETLEAPGPAGPAGPAGRES